MSKAKYSIGYYDDSTGFSGTTRYLLAIVRALDRDVFRPVLFGLERRAWHVAAEELGVEVVTLRPARPAAEAGALRAEKPVAHQRPRLRSWAAGVTRELLAIRKLFALRPVDLLHLNSAGAEVAPIAGRLVGAPVVLATWHVDSTYDLENLRGAWSHRALEMASMRSLHHSISVSRATAADWVRRCKLGDSAWRRISVIPNGIATGSLQPPEDRETAKRQLGLGGRLVIASMGRLDPAKGYEHLVSALPAVLARHPGALVRIAGSGPLRDRLASLAASLGVAGAIQFAGYTSAIEQFLHAADIYVQPSLCEAMPFAVLEAAATGLPVVASDVGGVAECVAHRETGLVVTPRDPAALADALVTLGGSPEIRRRMGEAGRRRVLENFRVDQMAAATVAVYRKLLERS